eukprot:GEMP01018655.1.p1 GENE.GEMP01018655.1~~GEMP01018655.1.p1  ORF type:complete len:283 (+),score=47.14 GEMP01018655.1:101-949(+)
MGNCIDTVQQDEIAIIEHCGKFSRTQPGGCLFLPVPCYCVKAGTISTRIQQLPVKVETKTKDNVFVECTIDVQYVAATERIKEAFYRLTNPSAQINSYVFDVVRGTVPKINLDDLFASKDLIADDVKSGLAAVMDSFGYLIIKTLVTDIIPAHKVREAMNDIETSKRLRHAAVEKAESDKLIMVKRAEAEAEYKYHQGAGIARQRKAIIEGMKTSVGTFTEAIEGMNARDVLELVLITQYFDTLKEIGSSSGCTTIFMGSNPAAMQGVSSEIRNGFMQSGAM